MYRRIAGVCGRLASLALCVSALSAPQARPVDVAAPPPTPRALFPDLFDDVQNGHVFADKQDVRGCGAQGAACANSGELSCSQTRHAGCFKDVCRDEFLSAVPRQRLGPPGRAGRHRAAYRFPLGHLDALQPRTPAILIFVGLTRSLRGTRRALSRNVLLGFVLHDAGTGDAAAGRTSSNTWSVTLPI